MADFIKVTDLNRLAKQVLAQCDPLNDVIVCGEISGFVRHYKSGHIYFTLKDENAGVKAVMFRSQARLLPFEPQNGMQVLVYGRATIYERDGSFQLYADYMRPFGAGAAQMAATFLPAFAKETQVSVTVLLAARFGVPGMPPGRTTMSTSE